MSCVPRYLFLTRAQTRSLLQLDGAIYLAINAFVNLYLSIRLLRDSRPIKFKNERDEKLWRGLYRRGGMSRVDMLYVGTLSCFPRVLRVLCPKFAHEDPLPSFVFAQLPSVRCAFSVLLAFLSSALLLSNHAGITVS